MPCPTKNPDGTPFIQERCNPDRPDYPTERNVGYVYINFTPYTNLTGTLGLSYDALKDYVDFKVNKFNPKFGVQWNVTDNLRLRLAWFETVKSFLVANQTIEPTQVAGFNQLFDDVNGTKARRMGIGLDARIASNLYGGIELSRRNLEVPQFTEQGTTSTDNTEKQQERLYQAYLYWVPHPHWAVRGESRFEKFTRAEESFDPAQIETLSTPVSLKYFHPSGILTNFTTTYIRQELKSLDESEEDPT